MAKLLISFPQRVNIQADDDPNQTPGQSDSESYRIFLNEEVWVEILQNFAGISEVIPVLSIGNNQSGCASTLEAFLGEGNEESFSSEDKPPGVYVWTRPVPLNSMSLLLVKMWGVDFISEEDKELDLITKKAMIALMSISSVCLFCGDKSSMFPSLTAVYELHTPIKERLDLKVSKFIVFIEKEATLESSVISRQCKVFYNRLLANPPVILCRGRYGISAMCKEALLQIVGSLQNHQAFLDSHKRVMEAIRTPEMIYALAIILTTILDMSRMNLDFRNFIHRIPHFPSPSFRAEIQFHEEIEKYSRSVLSGTALELFDKTTEESKSYEISESVLNAFHTNYQMDRPIIVMPIIGNQIMGKSTLLNHIVKDLLGCFELPKLFKTGNTTFHTTKASQVLSNPLRLGESKLMLVDLEGLEGINIANEREAILQDNLISAILTIASVPCILVRNELSSLNFAETIIEKLSNLNNYFGYKIKRVHLLVHDRDFDADTNPEIERYIQRINTQYFAGEVVLKLRNKPNFIEESNAERCEYFLRDLMADSNFPKQKKSGSAVLLKQLLEDMRKITTHNKPDMFEISLTDTELHAFEECAHEKSHVLREIFKSVQGDETSRSLEWAFDTEYRQLVSMCNDELWEQKRKWIRRLLEMLETEAASYRVAIVEIQSFHEMIEDLTQKDLQSILKEKLCNLYQKYRIADSFYDAFLALMKVLVTEKERYPRDSHQMDQIIQRFKEEQASLEILFDKNNQPQEEAALLSERAGPAANADRLRCESDASGKASASSFFRYIASKNLTLTDEANELLIIEKAGLWGFFGRISIRLNSNAIREFEGKNRPVMVFLVIAAKRMQASSMLNEFMRFVAPLTPSTINLFNDSKLTQILHFDYNNRRTCIVYLKMKKNKGKAMYKAVETIAVSLIQKVSFTCLFVDSPKEYASDIIMKAFTSARIPRREEGKQKFCSRVAVVYPENREDIAFLGDLSILEERGVQNDRLRVRDFSVESLKRTVLDVKNAFDKSTPIEIGSEALLEALRNAEMAIN